MPQNWKTYKIDQIADILNHKRVPLNSRERSLRSGKIPYYGASGIVDYIDDFIFTGEHVLISEDGENLRSRKTPIAFKADGTFWVNNHAHIVKGKRDYLNDWIIYYFATLDIGGYITGAVQPKLNKESLLSIPIQMPELTEVEAITSILSALDDKIELNLLQNKTLEEMAMTLYKHWFVNFGPFQDGEFVESELGMIPKGWEVKSLSEITEKITDGAHHSPKSVDEGFPMASVKDMTDWDINIETCRKISLDDYQRLVSSGCKPLANDILIAKDGSWLKHCFVVEDESELAILSSIAIIRVKDLISSYLLNMYLKLSETKTRLESFVTGAVIQRIVLKDFRNFKVLLPPKEEQEKVLKQIKPLFKKCRANNQENNLLIEKRDLLLPKLITGEIRVKDAEKRIHESL